MKRIFLSTFALGAALALSACSPTIPDSVACAASGQLGEPCTSCSLWNCAGQ